MNIMDIRTKASNVKTDESYLSVTFVKNHKKYTSVMPYSYFDQCCFDENGISMEILQKDSVVLAYDIGLVLQNDGLLMKRKDGKRYA